MTILFQHDCNGGAGVRMLSTAPTINTLGLIAGGSNSPFQTGAGTAYPDSGGINAYTLSDPGQQYGWSLGARIRYTGAYVDGFFGLWTRSNTYRVQFNEPWRVWLERSGAGEIASYSYPAVMVANDTKDIALACFLDGSNQRFEVWVDGVRVIGPLTDNTVTSGSEFSLSSFMFSAATDVTGMHVDRIWWDNELPGAAPPSIPFRPYYNNHTYR